MSARRYSVWALILLSVLMLGACRWDNRPDATAGTWVAERQALFLALGNWRAQGRMAITNGEDGGSIGFVLNDTRNGELRLNLSSAAGRWRLLAGPEGAELEGNRIPRRTARFPEPLVEEALGWYLPVSLMRDWIRGLPAPHDAHQIFAENGSLQRLEHADWQIDYERFREVDGHWLPQKIVARSGPYQVTLVILNWRLGELALQG